MKAVKRGKNGSVTPTGRADAIEISQPDIAEPQFVADAASAAEYVALMAAELTVIAGAAKLDLLTYFLDMARAEAQCQYQRRK